MKKNQRGDNITEIDYETFQKLSPCYRDLASQILLLLEERPMKTKEIAEKLECSLRSVRYHLNKIEEKVERRHRKSEVFWGLKSKVENLQID